MSPSDAARRLAPLIEAGRRLVGSTTTARLVRARVARHIDPALFPVEDRERVQRFLEKSAEPVLEPLSATELRAALREAWGADPAEELDELDDQPVAITPAAQVHRAVLDGKPVAVKVLRPGLGPLFRQDFMLLEALAGPLSLALPRVDATALLREVRERILDEFDLEHEAATQRRFHRALRRHPYLSTPAPVTRLATENVMVSEWVEGVGMLEADDPDEVAARLLVFVIGAAREGMAHADPDLDDVLVGPDGSLTILDYGAGRPVDRERLDHVLAAVEAFASADGEALGAELDALGVLGAERGAEVLALLQEILGELGGAEPTTLDVDAVIALAERVEARQEDVLGLILTGRVSPEDLWPGRAVAQLFAIITRLGARGPWRELILRALRDGWSAELP